MSARSNGLRVAFVAGLSQKKLEQKIAPLAGLGCVERIDVYRRDPFAFGDKVHWIESSRFGRGQRVAGELEKLAKLVARAGQYDLVVGCFQLYHGFWAYLAGALRHIPTVQLVITDVGWNQERMFARIPMLRADACVVRGDVSARKLRALGYAGIVGVIHNPLELPDLDSRAASPKRFDFIAVGDFAAEKDYPWMLEIFSRLKQRGVPFKARICGLGFERLVPAIRALGLEDRLDFPGHLGNEELDESYRASRMLVMTSSVEGLPMVAVEAMSHGLPVVATDVGEVPWLVRDGQDGVVVPHGDTDHFVDALAGLTADQGTLVAMGGSARDRIVELGADFSLDAASGKWLALLRGLGLTGQASAADGLI